MPSSYKGKYKPKNPDKYAGDPTDITYRSLWERKFMVFCDNNPNILSWASENIAIPYFSPIDNEYHRYFPDFIIKIRNKSDEIEVYLIEIKPEKQCKEPELGKKSKKTFLKEMSQWVINTKKWEAAQAYAKSKHWKFKILTERTLKV